MKPRYQSVTRIGRQFHSPSENRCTASINLNAITKKKLKTWPNQCNTLYEQTVLLLKFTALSSLSEKRRGKLPRLEKTITFSNILCRTVVPGCTRKQYGKRYSSRRENFISQVGKLTCNCDFAVAIFRDCLNCFLVYQFYSF